MVTEIPIVPPHESIEEELAASVAAADTLATTCRERDFLQSYYQHPVVHSSAPGTVWPLAIYVDGTPFSELDSILVIFVVNLGTNSRHLVGTLRKTGLCKCGCKGWCSIFFAMEFVEWSCLAMTSGMWPTASHDGKPWRGDSNTALSACRNTTRGSSALSFVSQEIGPNTPRHAVSPLAPRALTRASFATVDSRTCIRQAASDLAIYRGLSRTVRLTRQLVVDANGGDEGNEG